MGGCPPPTPLGSCLLLSALLLLCLPVAPVAGGAREGSGGGGWKSTKQEDKVLGEIMEARAEPVLCLPGPEYVYDFKGGGFKVRGKAVVVEQEGGQGRGTGWSVWDGSVATARYLEARAESGDAKVIHPDPPRVLELGAGTGLAGLSAAVATGLPVTLTDLPEVLPALERNTRLNPGVGDLVEVAELDWADPPPPEELGAPFGLLLASDCVWVEELIQPFVTTLERMAGPSTLVVMGYQSRSVRADRLLFGLLDEAGFKVELQPPVTHEASKVKIYRMRKEGQGGKGAE